MNYIELSISISPLNPEITEIISAELGFGGFESVVEDQQGLKAYTPEDDFQIELIPDLSYLQENYQITISHKLIKDQNWNASWESNFDPVIIGKSCIIKAPFHQIKETYDFEILIEPKMSFGTGHHETTSLMVEHIIENNFKDQDVLDMGSGTGVLAILACMKGAKAADAIDNDEWAFNNCLENVERNNCPNIQVLLGDAALLEDKSYDTIIANINRNILLKDMKAYATSLKKNGLLFLSGFYSADLEKIKKEAALHQLNFQSFKTKNDWIAASFIKA